MTRVDFYILNGSFQGSPELYACRLAEKALHAGHRIYIQTASQADSRQLDELLWTFRAGSFVPHRLAETPEPTRPLPTPIVIGTQEPETNQDDVLINLSGLVPSRAAHFARIAEVVGSDAASKTSARERYRRYREQRFELNSHDISA